MKRREVRTGWLILEEDTLKPIEFVEVTSDSIATEDEAPYSNDSGILQFYLTIEFPEAQEVYPQATIR